MYSNLDVLSYGFDEKIIEASRWELKNMIRIIDGLLNFSESIKIGGKTEINLENFLKKYAHKLEEERHIYVHNKQFNLSIYTDELLFSRVIKNLIDNALTYSTDGELHIYIESWSLRFENKIAETLSDSDIMKLTEKFFSKSFEEKKWHGIGIPMLKEICKNLWFKMRLYSKDQKFIVEIEL